MKNHIKLLIIQIICFTLICIGINVSRVNAEVQQVPEVAFLSIDHSPLVQGDMENYYITSKSVNKVQYRVFLYNAQTDATEELTQGYTSLMYADIPYKLASDHKFDIGSYKVTVWVKGENSSAEYDNIKELNLNCVEKDDTNRVYTSGEILTDKDTYSVGEKVQINGINNIHGMSSPYSYKVNIYNATKDEWENAVTNYGQYVDWTPKEAGIYVLDLWTISIDSTLQKTLDKDQNAKAFEGWKLKVINVKNVSDLATISKINITQDIVVQNNTYTLPNTINAILSDGSIKPVNVKWNSSKVDTSTPGNYTFEGKVENFSSPVSLTLTVTEKVNPYYNPYTKYIGKWSLKDSDNNDVVTLNIENIDQSGNMDVNILKFLPDGQYGDAKAAIINTKGTIINNVLKVYFDNDTLDNNGNIEASFKDDHIDLKISVITERASNGSVWGDETYTLKKD